jgi:hypothetical protein
MGGIDRAEIERWFIRQGVPHFIEGYSARRDVFTRSIPALVVTYLVGGFTALDIKRWSPARNLAVAIGIVALLVATWVVANGLRGRPWFERPRRVGRAELAMFVLIPVLPSLVFGQQWGDALEALAIGLGVLATIYLATSYALLPLTRWALNRLVHLLAALGGLVARALPLLLLFITFSFLAAEVWEMAGTLPLVLYPVVVVVFLLAGAGFLMSRLPTDIGSIGRFDSWDTVAMLVEQSPATGCLLPTEGAPPEAELTRRQWVNLALVSLFTQGVQITLVALTMGLFLVLFGFLTLSEQTVANWTHIDPAQVDVLVRVGMGNGRRDLVLTRQLLQVSGFLAAFTGFYFTVYLVTDETYRREFRDDVVAELRQALAVRAVYRHALTIDG